MKRRIFLGLAAAAAVFPRVALGQQSKKPLVVFLWAPGMLPQLITAYQMGLADAGLVPGQNIETRTFSAPTLEDLPVVAAQALAVRPDVLVVHGSTVAGAVHSLTITTPVVFGSVGDPIAAGLTMSLARPTANFTGASIVAPDLVGKELGIAKDVISGLTRIAGLNAVGSLLATVPQIPVAAKALGMEAVLVDFVQSTDFETQFDQVVAVHPQAVFVPASVYFSAHSGALADLQLRHKLPLLWPDAATEPRALIGYGPSIAAQSRKTGAYIRAILNGARPADLPIQQPTEFDFAINLTTAKALGISVPPAVLAQATIVTE